MQSTQYLNARLTDSPVYAWVAITLSSPRIRTRVVAIASMPSVTPFKEYSRSVTGTCEHAKL